MGVFSNIHKSRNLGSGGNSSTNQRRNSSSSISNKNEQSSSKSISRNEVIELAKQKGILNREGQINQGKVGEWQELQRNYKSIKGSDNLVEQGLARPGVQAKGSDRATTERTLRGSAERTARELSAGKALRGEDPSTNITVTSKAFKTQPSRTDVARQQANQAVTNFLNLRNQSIAQNEFNRQQQALQAQQQEVKSDKPQTVGEVPPYLIGKVSKVVSKATSWMDPPSEIENLTSFSHPGFALIAPFGGGQAATAAASAGQTGRTAKLLDTVGRTIYTAAGAVGRYRLINEGGAEVAKFINPEFKEVYENPQFEEALKTAKEAELQASYSQSVKVGGRNIPFIKGIAEELPFVSLNKNVYKETLLKELEGSGLYENRILQAAGLQQFSGDVAFTTAAIFIESQSELFGRTGVSQAARANPTIAVGQPGAQAAISKLVKPSLRRAGVVEGVSASVLYDASKDQEVNLLRAAASGAIGGFIAGEVGSFIAKKRIGQKGLSYATEGVADVIDLPELPGDITANIQQRSLRGGLRSGRVTLPPGVSYDDVIPSTLRVGKVRSPVGSIFGLGASPSQSETFGFSGPTPSTSFSTTRTAPSPITVPQPFSFSTTPSKIGTPAPITANIPSPISISITNPVPVPVTTQITIPNIRTPSTTNVEVPIPVPTFTPVSSNINIPVNVRDRFPFLPVSFGGGRGTKGKTKSNVGKGSTKTIFQSIFSGVDLSKITVKKGKEQTGLLLRG